MENDKIFSIMNDLTELRTEMDKNDIGSITENDMLYTLSFISLIRNGLDFSVISKVVGEKEDKVFIASEEAAIRVMEPDAENVWSPSGGEPVVVTVKEGKF